MGRCAGGAPSGTTPAAPEAPHLLLDLANVLVVELGAEVIWGRRHFEPLLLNLFRHDLVGNCRRHGGAAQRTSYQLAQSRCRCGSGEAGPGADVA